MGHKGRDKERSKDKGGKKDKNHKDKKHKDKKQRKSSKRRKHSSSSSSSSGSDDEGARLPPAAVGPAINRQPAPRPCSPHDLPCCRCQQRCEAGRQRCLRPAAHPPPRAPQACTTRWRATAPLSARCARSSPTSRARSASCGRCVWGRRALAPACLAAHAHAPARSACLHVPGLACWAASSRCCGCRPGGGREARRWPWSLAQHLGGRRAPAHEPEPARQLAAPTPHVPTITADRVEHRCRPVRGPARHPRRAAARHAGAAVREPAAEAGVAGGGRAPAAEAPAPPALRCRHGSCSWASCCRRVANPAADRSTRCPRGPQGAFIRPSGREPVLQLLGMVFSEDIAPAQRPAPQAQQQQGQQEALRQPQQEPQEQEQPQQPSSSSPSASLGLDADMQEAAAGPGPAPAACSTAAAPDATAGPAAAGPAAGAAAAAAAPAEAAAPEAAPAVPAGEAAPAMPPPAPRRVVGPAVPAAAVLAAARAAAEMLQREEEEEAAAEAAEMVGPPPPEMVEDADAGGAGRAAAAALADPIGGPAGGCAGARLLAGPGRPGVGSACGLLLGCGDAVPLRPPGRRTSWPQPCQVVEDCRSGWFVGRGLPGLCCCWGRAWHN
jgi:hypothetical protein